MTGPVGGKLGAIFPFCGWCDRCPRSPRCPFPLDSFSVDGLLVPTEGVVMFDDSDLEILRRQQLG